MTYCVAVGEAWNLGRLVPRNCEDFKPWEGLPEVPEIRVLFPEKWG